MPRKPVFMHSDLLPEARELGTETGWALWSDAVEEGPKFAPTQPVSMPVRLDGDPAFAATEPAPVDGMPPPRPSAAGASAPSLETLLQEVRRGNRVCPLPTAWLEVYAILQRHAGELGEEPPVPPPAGKAWKPTPPLTKRAILRQQLEWAAAHGCLPAMHEALLAIPDADWRFMDD
jgi:hypothetical protein